MSEVRHPEDLTWSYLRDFYYPRFRNKRDPHRVGTPLPHIEDVIRPRF